MIRFYCKEEEVNEQRHRYNYLLWTNRKKWNAKKALKFYRECANFSEGAEHERYCNIILDLLDGKKVAHDTHW